MLVLMLLDLEPLLDYRCSLGLTKEVRVAPPFWLTSLTVEGTFLFFETHTWEGSSAIKMAENRYVD